MLSSDSGHYRQAFEGFQEAWGSSVPFVVLGEREVEGADAVVAFGSRAALKEWPEASVVVSCLAPGSESANGPAGLRVEMLPEPAALAARLKRLMPSLKRLRVVWTSADEKPEVDALAAAAAAAGFSVDPARLTPGRLPAQVRALARGDDALWLMPDPALVNAENFAVLKEYAAAERLPFFAPADGLVKMGATATLAASFRQLGRTAAEALKSRLAGGAPESRVHSKSLTVTVSAAAARTVGLNPDPGAGVDEALP